MSQEFYVDISEEGEVIDELCEFNEYVAMLLQDYDRQAYDVKYNRFVKEYQENRVFSQIVWAFCLMDKRTNTFEELLEQAILGHRIKFEVPIPKVAAKPAVIAKDSNRVKYLKEILQMWQLKINVDEDDDDDDEVLKQPKQIPIPEMINQTELLYKIISL